MRFILLILIALPFAAGAQQVQPIFSGAYRQLIADSGLFLPSFSDTSNDIRKRVYPVKGFSPGAAIAQIKNSNNSLRVRPARYRFLYFSGQLNSTAEIRRANRLPSLQQDYVQGRSFNGKLAWQGPETQEVFSFGPDIRTLEFDGTNYPYDIYGRLTAAGTGNGRAARGYDNSVLRTASHLLHSLRFQVRYVAGRNNYLFAVNLGRSDENTIIRDSRNRLGKIGFTSEISIRSFKLKSAFASHTSEFSYPNRYGFLNRVYQSALLTPISFANEQGTTLTAVQRSFSSNQDNPLFLLEKHRAGYRSRHQSGNLTIEQSAGPVSFRLLQSAEKWKENSSEGYVSGSAGFSVGTYQPRQKTVSWYSIQPVVTTTNLHPGDAELKAAISYLLTNGRTRINYAGKEWDYHRLVQDGSVSVSISTNAYPLRSYLRLENKTYASSTASASDFFLPGISGYLMWQDIFSLTNLSLRVTAAHQQLRTELPLSNESARHLLLSYRLDQSQTFFPAQELKRFSGIRPVDQRETMMRIQFDYRNNLSLQAEAFVRKYRGDVFPVENAGDWELQNLVDHRTQGIELELGQNFYRHRNGFSMSNTVSFTSYADKVTSLPDGRTQLAIAGFSDIRKAAIAGQQMGVIVGSRYLRDAAGRIQIGYDGYPLVDPQPGIIANPNPDFVLKISHSLSWRRFSFNLDWEWKKGGQAWNGTQAALDYYGRSELSANERNTSNFLFEGILPNGHMNDLAVRFYDPTRPVSENRWVRYGFGGVAESYVQPADAIRIHSVGLSYRIGFKKTLQSILCKIYAGNLLVWTPYRGNDPDQLLFDQAGTSGLDYFNLPSTRDFGASFSIQF